MEKTDLGVKEDFVIPMEKTVEFKIDYRACIRRLKYTKARVSGCEKWEWSPDLSFETLHSRIEKLFDIPSTQRFLVTYTDVEGDVITMSTSDDLIDIIEGRSVSLSARFVVRLHLSQIKSDDVQHEEIAASQIIPMTGTGVGLVLPPEACGGTLGSLVRRISYNLIKNRPCGACMLEPRSLKKLIELYETFSGSTGCPFTTQSISLELVEHLLIEITRACPMLVWLHA